MKRIVWTAAAKADFRRIYRYLAVEDFGMADRIGDTIIGKAYQVAEHPMAGTPLPAAGRRKSNVTGTPYLIIYTVRAGGGIDLLHIFHQSQNWR